jgi:hypothetical protein
VTVGLSLAPIFLALILTSMPLAADLTFPTLIDGELIRHGQPPPPFRPPGAITLPMVIVEWRAAPVIGVADAHRAQQQA